MGGMHALLAVGLAMAGPGELRFSRAVPMPADVPPLPDAWQEAAAALDPDRRLDLPELGELEATLVWMLLHDPRTEGRAYTLLVPEPAGTLRVDLGAEEVRVTHSDARPPVPEKAPDELEAAMGGARIKGRWQPEELDVLWAAWSRLDEGERAMVGPLVAKRRRKAGKGVRASVTQRFDRHVLVVSDALFEPATGIEFGVGPAEAPVRFDVSLLVHELGHAVDFGPSRRAYAAWMEGGPGAKDARRCGAAWDEAGHQAAVLLGLDPTIGPSEYGAMMLEAGEPQEDFAESFMLFKLDPDFLREQSPVRFEWFDGGAHTRWPQRTDGPAEVCRPLPL